MKHKDLVLSHLRKGTITSMEAIRSYGITRLAARVADLRREGWKISTKTIKSNGKSFAEYRLEKQDEQTSIQDVAGEGSLRMFSERQELF